MASSSKRCNFCRRGFDNLLEHEKICTFLYDGNDDYFVLCDYCNSNALSHDHAESCSVPSPKRRKISSPINWASEEDFNQMVIDYLCTVCGESFANHEEKIIHEAIHQKEFCAKCGEVFDNIFAKNVHETRCQTDLLCSSCGGRFRSAALFAAHTKYCLAEINDVRREPHVGNLLANAPTEDLVQPYETAFVNRLASYFIQSDFVYDLPMFLNDVKRKIDAQLIYALDTHGPVKFNLNIDCLLGNVAGDQQDANLKTKFEILLHAATISRILASMFRKLETELSEVEVKGSGWKLEAILGLRLKIVKYSPLRGGSDIKLPKKISDRKACVNVPGDDNMCFKYAVLAKFIPINHGRKSVYGQHEGKYDFSCVTFPVSYNDVKRFEKKNNVSINIFTLKNNTVVVPWKIVKEEKEDHRDLLMLEEGERRHYTWIKDFNKLVHSQITSNCRRVNVCKRCLWFKQTDQCTGDVKDHENLCNNNPPVQVNMPQKEKAFTQFTEVEKTMRLPYVVYADFEALLEKIENPDSLDPSKAFRNAFNKHIPISAAAYLKIDPEYEHLSQTLHDKRLFTYRGTDVVEKLLAYLRDVAIEVEKITSCQVPMTHLTQQQWREYHQAKNCYLCDREFSVEDPKVRDHCHTMGHYRGAAHRSCNVNFRRSKFLPTIFHNLSSYDAQFIIPKLNYDDGRIDVIAANKEKYISFSKHVSKSFSIRFLDSYRFLPSSLDGLAQNLTDFSNLKQYFPDPAQFELAKQKGVYPYEYMDSSTKFEETQLPPKTAFYSKLRQEGISDADYQRAQRVWDTFKCKNLGEYSELYNKIDTLLLADIYESFRATTLTSHKLDPAHFFTTPQMTWTAMLKYTKVKLELLTDYNMLLMFESGIRGGLCQVSKRFVEANNPLLPNYDPEKEHTYISYQDCNALYATVMTKNLPMGDFTWVDPKDVPDLDRMEENDNYGYLLDVDIENYPEELHEDHNDLPFFAEKRKDVGGKLVAHLGPRKNYVVHYMALEEAKKYGVLRGNLKINRAIRFKQTTFLEKYITLNNNLRKNAKNDFEKDLFKLFNNAIYGKTCENIRKRIDVKLVTKFEQAEKLMAKSNFIDANILDENFVAIQMSKTSIVFNKPIYIGQAVLDLSKNVMYNYLYGVMKHKYPGDLLKLCYMDTDSFVMEIRTPNFYEDMKGHMMDQHLDTSNYPQSHELYSAQNKKKLGFFKDEAGGKVISRFIGLRPKMYAIDIHGDKEYKRVKGIQRCVVKNRITFDDYIDCLQMKHDEEGNLITRRDLCTSIRSKKHNLFSIQISKKSLSPFDDKRHIQEDGVNTLALFHKSLQ